ncbi:hypothetical protein QA640_08895 [Bradyrhizobium sp. CB82]|uniref:hypothetical protein n=1 Tax=Bradyrhizobium sp. CB82 TaxID=3039159 RepID=UPI0024B13942|nr:hypothetical protein [Bradyrhizobium sp. CB82]WFU42561.1 hypothetical protein QA640_08895 [Bradyrhizobium sp. CB82]
MTPATIKALRWFASRGEVGWFDRTAPGHSMRTRLLRRGLIETVKDGRPIHLKRLRLSEQGREMLRENGWL